MPQPAIVASSATPSPRYESRMIELFCHSHLEVKFLRTALRTFECTLQRTIQPKNQATQYHFEAPYGVSVLFLAGTDPSNDVRGLAPPIHTGRLWITGNTHPRSLEIQRHIRAKLEELTGSSAVEAPSLTLAKGA